MTRLLAALLRAAGLLIYRLGLDGVLIRRRPGYVRVLLYHACEERTSDFTAGLLSSTTPAQFAAHLAYYARRYRVVPADRLETGPLPERAAVITFDDGYRSVLEHAAPLLAQRAMNATVYLITSVVGNARLVWVNEANWLLRRHPAAARAALATVAGVPESATPEAFIDALRARGAPADIERALQTAAEQAGVERARCARDARLYLDWDEVAALRGKGIRFGNHTVTHPSLPRLSPDGQRQEFADARAALDARGADGSRLAYPFGDHDGHSRAQAVAAGCTSIMEVGVNAGPLDPLRIGRVPVDGLESEAELFARIEIVEPAKAWLRRLGARAR